MPERRRALPGTCYEGPDGRGTRRGRSGYGMESIRPHLRAQLELHSLLRPSYLAWDLSHPGNHSTEPGHAEQLKP